MPLGVANAQRTEQAALQLGFGFLGVYSLGEFDENDKRALLVADRNTVSAKGLNRRSDSEGHVPFQSKRPGSGKATTLWLC